MGGIDKLDEDLEGRSVLRWSVEALAAAGAGRIVIVTSPARIPILAAAEWLPDSVVAVVAGGERRQESVAAGIAALGGPDAVAPAEEPGAGHASRNPNRQPAEEPGERPGGRAAPNSDPVILVHDAARPLASAALVRAVAEATWTHGAAIPVLPVAETLKRLDGRLVAATVDRTDVVAAQTPQGVRRSLMERAYAEYPPDGPETWTDEASLLEACRIPVHAISGEATNLKVTVPVDLERARAMLEAGLVPGREVAPGSSVAPLPAAMPGGSDAPAGSLAAPPPPFSLLGRVGLGTDSHTFGPGGPLRLGGISFEGAPRLAGHSDGDVALHAVADALLGAAGLGDLGRLFPADSRTPAGIDSRVLLAAVAEKVRAAGWRLVNVDMTIVASRPRLSNRLPEMAASIASVLGLDPGSVNVKASSGNLEGSEGAGRAISASAIVSLVPLGDGAGERP